MENPWKIGPPWTTRNPNDEYEFVGPYDEANFFWREFRNKEYLHRKYWKRNLMQWIRLLDEPHYQYIFKQAQFRGTLLRDMGFWNLLGSVLSHMATVKLRDWASFYHLLPENPSAAAWIIFWLRGLKSTNALKGIRGGMDLIVHKLCDRLDFEAKEHEDEGCSHVVYGNKTGVAASSDNKSAKLCLNRKLVRIEDTGDDIQLTFQKMTRTMEAGEISLEPTGEEEKIKVKGHVILALPKGSLRDIEFVGRNPETPKLLRQMFDAVSSVPLLKCFFVVDNPFWEDNRPANRYAGTVPTRELHYWKSEDKQTGLLMIYTDPPGIQFWSDYLAKDLKKDISRQLGKDEGSVFVLNLKQSEAKIWCWSSQDRYPGWVSKKFDNDRLVRTFLRYAQHGGAESITADAILAAGMRDWGLEPYEAAVHAWRPNTTPQEIMSYLSAFSLSGAASGKSAKRIHICGEAYSDFQGFIEGALRSAAMVLTQEPFSLDNAELTGASRKPAPSLPRTLTIPEHEKQSSARAKTPM